MIPVQPPKCGRSALFQPLIQTDENAFNPCFLTSVLFLWATLFSALGILQVFRYLKKPAYGPYAPKNTGLAHWLRCLLVLVHAVLYAALLWSTSIVERFADDKIAALTALFVANAAVLLPLHFIETTRSLIPQGILLVFWPGAAVLDLALWYQDRFTNWPVILQQHAPATELIAFLLSLAVFALEISGTTWKPSTLLLREHARAHPDGPIHLPPNFLSRLTFSWMNPLIKKSYVNQTVSYEDLPEAPSRLTTDHYTSQLSNYWHAPNSPKTASHLTWCAIKAFGPLGVVSFFYEAGDSLLAFAQPQLLRLLILFLTDKITDPSKPIIKGFLLCLAMFAVTLVQTAFNNQYVLRILEVGLGCRSSLTSLIFQKSLRMSSHSRSERSSGDIVNLVSIDAPRVQTCAQELSTLIIAPVELALSLWSLYYLLGKSAFAGLIVMMIFLPIHSFFLRYSKRLNKKQMKLKDHRNRITNEILVSIKSIKLYAWEKPMLNRLFEARNDKELKNMKHIRIINQFGVLIWTTMPFLVSFSTFGCFVLIEEKPLTSDIVFPALTLLNILSKPIMSFPATFTYITEAIVAIERISAFLATPEVDPSLIKFGDAKEEDSLVMKNLTFLWQKPDIVKNISEDMDFTTYKWALKAINLNVKKGEFVCIVGKVGSGKSSLLSAFLGQLNAINSSNPSAMPCPITINGSVGYCSQNPWIMNASVKENILFGHEFDQDYYNITIRACQLLPDLKILPDGDETQVGEKGISLSGGQKARLSLARAIYTRADVYLLDDVLSAVDSHVGKNIIAQVLGKDGLLADKTVVLATNNIPVLESADKIYLFENGSIIEQSTYTNIMVEKTKSKLSDLVIDCGYSSSRSNSPMASNTTEIEDRSGPPQNYRKASLAPFNWNPMKTNIVRKTGPTKEMSAKGSVKSHVYYEYIQACSVAGMALWLFLFVFATIASVSTNYWLKKWAEANSNIGDNRKAIHFVTVYALLGFGTSVLNLSKGVVYWVFLSIRGGRDIHDRMAKSLMKAPMNFFERTPVGRILNRFSNDVNKVDSALPRSFNIWMGSMLTTVSTIVVIGLALPVYLIVVVVLAFVYGYYQRYYISVQRELKRLVSVSRSPIFAHFQESLTGVETIKAFQQEERFSFINNANVDFNMRSLFMLRSINRWLSVRLQFIGSLVIWSSSTMLIYKSTSSSPISAGMAGFVMSYALQVTYTFKKMVRMSAEVEANIVSVERCLEYCKLPSEENQGVQKVHPQAGWPHRGTIEFENYSTRYSEKLELVLKNISLSIKSGEKIGVVGRTGAGKSSLVLAIFRMISAVEGRILVDRLDTSQMALFDLRHNLSIIPQDSHLFEGTLRDNLDPFGECSDEMLWKVLEHASMKDTVLSLDNGLESKVHEAGSNFSAGQQQLMCLGRALLNDSKILILDEATAAVDVQTDRVIQNTIRREFKHRTVVTIAHRLDTVMDSDRIIGLDHGEVREFDSPSKLLENPQSIFYNLCKQGNYI